MNKRIYRAIAILTLSLGTANAFGQTAPRTVTDYLLALPASQFQLVHPGFQYERPQPKTKGEMDDFRRSRIVVEDVQNGYLKYVEAPSDKDLDWTEVALFKKKDGGYVMAIGRSVFSKGCDTTLSFLEYNNGSWLNVTKKYYPRFSAAAQKKIDKSIFCFTLPQIGRTLRAYSKWYDGPEETFENFEWNGEMFVERP